MAAMAATLSALVMAAAAGASTPANAARAPSMVEYDIAIRVSYKEEYSWTILDQRMATRNGRIVKVPDQTGGGETNLQWTLLGWSADVSRTGSNVGFGDQSPTLKGSVTSFSSSSTVRAASVGDVLYDYTMCEHRRSSELPRGKGVGLSGRLSGSLTHGLGLVLVAPTAPLTGQSSSQCEHEAQPSTPVESGGRLSGNDLYLPPGPQLAQALDFPRTQVRFGRPFKLEANVTIGSDVFPGSRVASGQRTRTWTIVVAFVPCGRDC